MVNVEKEIEQEMNNIAAKHKSTLKSALIQPFAPEWQFCTNGLYLLLATAGCGKRHCNNKCDELPDYVKRMYS